jgi:hypothetical protein
VGHNGEPWPSLREQQCGHARTSDRDVRAHAAGGGLTAHFFADRLRRPEQACEPADVHRHEIVAVPLVARREFLRDGD